MPLPSLLLLTFATGIATALAARAELRVSPRPAHLSRGFFSFGLYACLVLAPISLYFYVFHGDWFLLYLVDVKRIPSALVLISCAIQIGLGAAGYLLGAAAVRAQREQWAGAGIGACVAVAGALLVLARERLAVVGTFAQFRGDFGLMPFGGALLQGSLWMSLWMGLGMAFLLYRLGPGARRG